MISSISHLIETALLCSLSAWALVEWSRPVLSIKKISNRQHRALIYRSLALLTGGLIGAVIHPQIVEGATTFQGAIIGISAGSLNALMVRTLKRKGEK